MPAEAQDSGSLRLTGGQRVALLLVRAYQLLFSPMFAGSCRFTPSCSRYAADAIARFGVLRGGYLAVRRLSRCHPFGAHGVDPVPDFAPWGLRRGRPDSAASAFARRTTADRSGLRRGKPDFAPPADRPALRRGKPADSL